MLNKVMLIGNLGQDPEIRFTPTGTGVCNLSIATSEKIKDKQTGQYENRTEWHKVVAFGKPAEIIAQYAKSGSKMYIEGKLRTRKWEKDGVDRFTTEIVIDFDGTFKFLGSETHEKPEQTSGLGVQPQNVQRAAPAPAPAPIPTGGKDGFPDYEKDDIPF